jgi:DNA-binding NarL/FixJ family response regulator
MNRKKTATSATGPKRRLAPRKTETRSPSQPGPGVTSVFIIDDHELLSATLRDVLDLEDDFEVLGTSGDGAEALARLAKTPADIVLLDLVLPGLNGVEVSRKIVSLFPNTKIAVCSGVDSDEAIELAFASGAHLFVEKRAKVEELLKALRTLRDGKCFLTERQARVLKDSVRRRSAKKPLAPHDIDILRKMVLNKSAKEIAAEQGVSQSCVYKARRRIVERVGAGDVGSMQVAAARLGLVNQGLGRSWTPVALAEEGRANADSPPDGGAGAKSVAGRDRASPLA